MVDGLACGSCGYGKTCNEQQYCVEIENPDFSGVDEDYTDETPDIDSAYCPLLTQAPFPYYREDGTIHFCRPCDIPTEKDPQCVQNLWSMQNKKYAFDYPEADCYPYPCDMPNMKPMSKEEYYTKDPGAQSAVYMHDCDWHVAPDGWLFNGGNHGGWKTFSLSGGKIGLVLDKNMKTSYLTDQKAYEYDIQEKAFKAIGPTCGENMSYKKSGYFLFMSDFRNLDLSQKYRYLGYYTTDGVYKVVYNKPVNFMAYTPAVNEKWVFGNITEDGSTYKMMYAKIGEWKWQSLEDSMGYMPDISEDKLAVTDANFKAYICDLSKYPKSASECFLVNRDQELATAMVFDKQNNNRFVYSSDYSRAITKVDMSGGVPVYEDIITDYSDDMKIYNAYSLVPKSFSGNVIMYNEVSGNEGDYSLACFYRLDLKKRYCMKPLYYQQGTDTVEAPYKYGFSEFEGNYLLFQQHGSASLLLRDMKCYCEKEGVCPLEGLDQPNPVPNKGILSRIKGFLASVLRR